MMVIMVVVVKVLCCFRLGELYCFRCGNVVVVLLLPFCYSCFVVVVLL